MGEKKRYRLFIGVFARVEDYNSLKQKLGPSFHGRWVKPKNLHMTFKFLGDIYEPQTIIEKLEKLKYNKKQTVEFKKLKVFGKRILSLRSSNKTLYKIHDQIQQLLGVEFENEKSFKPHITLMRIKKIRNKEYKQLLKTIEVKGQLQIKVCLVQSKMTPKGVKYKTIREF